MHQSNNQQAWSDSMECCITLLDQPQPCLHSCLPDILRVPVHTADGALVHERKNCLLGFLIPASNHLTAMPNMRHVLQCSKRLGSNTKVLAHHEIQKYLSMRFARTLVVLLSLTVWLCTRRPHTHLDTIWPSSTLLTTRRHGCWTPSASWMLRFFSLSRGHCLSGCSLRSVAAHGGQSSTCILSGVSDLSSSFVFGPCMESLLLLISCSSIAKTVSS